MTDRITPRENYFRHMQLAGEVEELRKRIEALEAGPVIDSPSAPHGRFHVKHCGFARYNVLHPNGTKVNEVALDKDTADKLADEMNATLEIAA